MSHKIVSVDISALAQFALKKMKDADIRSIVVTFDKEPLYILGIVSAIVADLDVRLIDMKDKMDKVVFVRNPRARSGW